MSADGQDAVDGWLSVVCMWELRLELVHEMVVLLGCWAWATIRHVAVQKRKLQSAKMCICARKLWG